MFQVELFEDIFLLTRNRCRQQRDVPLKSLQSRLHLHPGDVALLCGRFRGGQSEARQTFLVRLLRGELQRERVEFYAQCRIALCCASTCRSI